MTIRQVGKRIITRIILKVFEKVFEKYPTLAEQLAKKALEVRYEIPVAPTHYYSPLPDIAAVKNKLSRWYKRGTFEGIDINIDKQKYFLEQLKEYKEECDSLPNFAQVTEEGYGLGYGEVEAHFLHCMIRHLKPRQIIEIGSGVSTFFSLNALQINTHQDNNHSQMVCIEPYPNPKLQELVIKNKVVLREKEVQDVEIELFRELNENDILFIDSSHVSKVDSDVNWLYLEVLPILKKGVVIQIHDIPFPYLGIPLDHPLFNLFLLWNEAALVKAFLLFNEAFEIIMCQSYLHFDCPETIREVVSIYDEKKHFPSSLWLVKTM
jgi:predicted O-methyltransferase YrrM